MTQVQFQAQELQADGSFQTAQFQFTGNEKEGWTILRNEEEQLKIGPGYTLVQSLYCGVCSTDLARHFLPYPLPQIVGHEVVGLVEGKPVVVEINASHKARGFEEENCPFCSNGMGSQCPERITLGINELPGGFSPWFLAPVKAIQPVPVEVSSLVASFTEPFAAALQGVEATFPKNGDDVAVLGPRRLGMLILAALYGFRKQTGRVFKITAIVRHEELEEACTMLGADEVINLNKESKEELRGKFEIVYDTTGKVEGFETALKLADRVVHLKSTNGQQVQGLNHLTDMVVDEIALLPYKKENLNYKWPIEQADRANKNILISPTVPEALIKEAKEFHPAANWHRMDSMEARKRVQEDPSFLKESPFPRFDLAIVTTLEEIDQVLRPVPGEEFSPIRARGAILLAESTEMANETKLSEAMRERGIEIHSSRCGNFERALKVLQDNSDITKNLEEKLITHQYPLDQISEAFQTAANSGESIKVVVETTSGIQ